MSKISSHLDDYEEFQSEKLYDLLEVNALSSVISSFAVCKSCGGSIEIVSSDFETPVTIIKHQSYRFWVCSLFVNLRLSGIRSTLECEFY